MREAWSSGELPPGQRRIVTLALVAATLLQTLDTTVANIALPHMQGTLSASQDQMSWVLTSYIVASAIFMPLTGYLADRFGRRRLLLLAVGGFTLASMLCGAAQSLMEIVAFRALQGVFGAALMPLSQSVMIDITPREQYSRVTAYWGAASTMGPVLGPMVGGFLTDHFNWRWVFYINVPIGILAYVGLMIFLTEVRRRDLKSFDLLGFGLLSLGVGALQLMLDRGQTQDWFGAKEIWIEFGLAVAGLWMFLVHSLTTRHPFVDVAIFKDRNLTTAMVLAFLFFGLFYANLAMMPPLLQSLMNYPVLTAGELMAPRGLGSAMAMLLLSRIGGKIDSRLIMVVGLSISALSLSRMSHFAIETPWQLVALTGLGHGFGLGMVTMTVFMSAFSTLPAHLRSQASGIFSLVRNLGGSIGISFVENLFERGTQVSHAALAGHVTPFNPALRMPQVLAFWNIGSLHGLAALDGEINRQAAMIAYADSFKFSMIVVLLMVPLVMLIRGGVTAGASGKTAAMD